ncbi:hypothetical protein [uncultured Polaribacter sp.]|uniref:hypothetical protein n=1 Tax=uncultured Polaribacter sp. TaxID=174711 RepID=UPI0030DD2697|tara:strand:- start:1224 stop:1841 length:618 start_codon:yes stop_codon:yes gene_type:complete
MESIRKQKENEWLALLENAINENVQIRANHRFKYKNKNLGTFLVSARRKPNVELIKKIEGLGFVYKTVNKDPESFLKKYTLQLSKDKKPHKHRYITRFNASILPRKDSLSEKSILKLNRIWKVKFGDIRKWEKPETDLDRINNWKEYRYNKELNPNGKWFDYRKYMGRLYGWVYTRKRDTDKMNIISEHFSKKELNELKKEGFFK